MYLPNHGFTIMLVVSKNSFDLIFTTELTEKHANLCTWTNIKGYKTAMVNPGTNIGAYFIQKRL
jgi:hypothetical protein